MIILTIVLSILGITTIAVAIRKLGLMNVCPVCAGVAGTWLWMLAGMALGQLSDDQFVLPVAVLMGGSVVGIWYQIEKRLKVGMAILPKALFLALGFATVYAVLLQSWKSAGLLVVPLAIFSFVIVMRSPTPQRDQGKSELEQRMEKCC